MQRFIEETYPILLDVCKVFTPNYEDLAHDVILKIYDNPKIKEVKLCEIRFYYYVIARNTYLTQIKDDRFTELTYEPKAIESELETDPYEYIQRIRESELDELDKIWIDLYLDEGGNFIHIERKMKKIGVGVSRQTIAQRIKDAINKLNGIN